MTTIKEIRELKDYLVNDYHSNRIKQQETDQTYIEDTFTVPYIKENVATVRTGKGFRMCSAPAEHIITSNPQFFKDKVKDTDTEANRVGRIAKEGNRWLRLLLRQNPQPFKQSVKHLLGRGELWIYTVHNNDFKTDSLVNMPISFVLFDPLVVFADRTERNGVPDRVVISYQRQISSIQDSYPEWTWKNDGVNAAKKGKVPFFMYYDNETRYFEAGGEGLLRDADGNLSNGDGLQQNIYGFVPFSHAYSGFGMGSVDNDPAYLAVGRLRYCREKIAENTAMRSTVNSIIFRYAHKPLDLIFDPTVGKPPENLTETYSREPNAFNQVPIPGFPGSAQLKEGQDMLPDIQLFQYLSQTEIDIDKEDPLGSVSGAIGTSGRQQDMATQASLRRYDTVVENCAHCWETAFGQAFRLIGKLPNILLPSNLREGDITDNYECRIELKADDPVDRDRILMAGRAMQQAGQMSLRSFLIESRNMTEEQADNEIDQILAEKYMLQNPEIVSFIGAMVAQKSGMAEELNAYLAQKKSLETAKEFPLSQKPGSRGGEPRQGNIQTPMGMEMADVGQSQGGIRSPAEVL